MKKIDAFNIFAALAIFIDSVHYQTFTVPNDVEITLL